jgi:hypothetical protein
MAPRIVKLDDYLTELLPVYVPYQYPFMNCFSALLLSWVAWQSANFIQSRATIPIASPGRLGSPVQVVPMVDPVAPGWSGQLVGITAHLENLAP